MSLTLFRMEDLLTLKQGPFDLAKQMGVQRGGEEHEAAILRTLAAANAAGKKAAIFCTNGEDARVRAEQGFHMISVVTDVGVIGDGMQKELATAKGAAAAGKREGY